MFAFKKEGRLRNIDLKKQAKLSKIKKTMLFP